MVRCNFQLPDSLLATGGHLMDQEKGDRYDKQIQFQDLERDVALRMCGPCR
jgi:hypothetical protein